MSTASDIEVQIEEAKRMVDESLCLHRLMQNQDFKKIITTGYFLDEASRLVELKAAPSMQGDKEQQNIIKAIDSIGGLQQYFNKINILGEQARYAIESGNEELDNLAGEE